MRVTTLLGAAAMFLVGVSPGAAPPASVFSFTIGGYGEQGVALAVDAAGNGYVLGSRYQPAAAFPVTDNAAQKTAASIYVAKVDGRGDRLTWATYLGGSRNRNSYWRGPLEIPAAIAVDGQNNVVVVGSTAATDFPMANAAIPSAQADNSEGFLTKISADGSRLVYSTYLMGYARAVAADMLGNAYVALQAENVRLPFETRDLSAAGTHGSIVVAKFNPAGEPVFATRFGAAQSRVSAIAVDSTGAVLVTGETNSSGFPLVNSLATSCRTTGEGCSYVAKLDPTGARLVYSTPLGGAQGRTTTTSIAVSSSGDAYVAGSTDARDYPVLNAYQRVPGGGADYVLTRLGPGGTLLASTFLGGDVDETSYGPAPRLLLDATGRATLIGATAAVSGLAPDLRHPDVPLWRSDDGGATWVPSAAGLRGSAWVIAVSERDRQWYLGARDGVYRSADGGANWQWAMSGVPEAGRETFALAVDPARRGVLYAGTRAGTYRTTDRGATWTKVDTAFVSGGPYHPASHTGFVVDGNGTLFLGSEGVRRSFDGGATWVDSSAGLQRGPTGRYMSAGPIVFDPNVAGTVYAMQSDRLFRSRDGGGTWAPLEPPRLAERPYPVSGLQGVAFVPGRPGRIYVSGWSELLRSDDDGWSWQALLENQVFRPRVLIDPAEPEKMYAFDNLGGSAMLVSSDDGRTWSRANLPRDGQRVVMLDALQPGVLFAPAEVRSTPFVVTMDADLIHLVDAAFVDGPPAAAAAVDAGRSLFVLRTIDGKSVLTKLQPQPSATSVVARATKKGPNLK